MIEIQFPELPMHVPILNQACCFYLPRLVDFSQNVFLLRESGNIIFLFFIKYPYLTFDVWRLGFNRSRTVFNTSCQINISTGVVMSVSVVLVCMQKRTGCKLCVGFLKLSLEAMSWDWDDWMTHSATFFVLLWHGGDLICITLFDLTRFLHSLRVNWGPWSVISFQQKYCIVKRRIVDFVQLYLL